MNLQKKQYLNSKHYKVWYTDCIYLDNFPNDWELGGGEAPFQK